MRRFFYGLSGAVALMSLSVANAAELKIGVGSETSSIDPQFSTVGTNISAAAHVFDRLIHKTPTLQLEPGLATSWTAIDAKTWELKLRKGVKFHDGSDFDAKDVIRTIERIPLVKDSPSTFKRNIKTVKSVEAVDPHTVRFHMKKANPQFPILLSFLSVISNELPADVTSQDFNTGKAAIGTGPYKFVEWVHADRIVYESNKDYWGGKPAFDKVTLKPISSDPSRVTALLAGDVDMIDTVPPLDVARLEKDKAINLWRAPSSRMMYIHMDTDRDDSPFVRAKDGSKLAKNPLKDIRVRRAISKAVHRDAIVAKVFQGAAQTTGQFVPKGMIGWAPDIKPDAYDLAGAKKLLAEAGYPDGFAVTLQCTNNRYVNDEQVGQTIAQLLARAGIKVSVEAMPKNMFFPRATKREFSMFMLGFGNSTGDAARGLTAVLATYDKKAGMGANNRGRYSNPEFDKLIRSAAVSSDAAAREKMLQDAARVAIAKDVGIVPLYFPVTVWATRKGVDYVPRMDDYTLAQGVSVSK
jgi:peptide/nickel transport system substrate-binding protein